MVKNFLERDALLGRRTWIEISRSAAKNNYRSFRKLVGPKVELWPVVKSNAYGHGLFVFSKLMQEFGADGLCVDSVLEAFALRREGIKIPILVLGPTLPVLFKKASQKSITITISNFNNLSELAKTKNAPYFHIKIDTGMHRQGFFSAQIPRVIRTISSSPTLKRKLRGIYTHFAMATDKNNVAYTQKQFSDFELARSKFRKAGFNNLSAHCSASGGALLHARYHLDMARVGKGLYGFFPSKELERQSARVKLQPILAWRTVITEIKNLKPGDMVGYDLTEKIKRRTQAAILPVGYWHGFPRALSGVGEVLIRGKRARVLGRVSMDLLVVDVTGIKCAIGDFATLIGKSGKEEIGAKEVAQKAGTISYEILTRLNPLIERVIIR